MATRKPSFLTNSVPQTANTLQKFKIPLFDLTAWPASGQCGRHRLSIGYIGAMLKYLRIAVTALSLTACVLLIALWVRSYSLSDDLRHCDGTTLINFQSALGEFGIGHWGFPKRIPWSWTVESIETLNETLDEPVSRLWSPMKDQAPLSYVGIRWQTMPPMTLFAVRYWFPVALTAALAILPWLSRLGWRFSLRTLLIATTVVAVALGIFAVSS